MESIHSFAQAHAVFLSGLILILAYIFIATEKVSKVTVALIGACAAIFLDLVSQDKTSAGGAANAHYYKRCSRSRAEGQYLYSPHSHFSRPS